MGERWSSSAGDKITGAEVTIRGEMSSRRWREEERLRLRTWHWCRK